MIDKYPIKFYSINSTDILQIMVFISDKCLYNCWYCYNDFPRTLKDLNLDKLYIFLKRLTSISNRKIYVDLIGGEPTLHIKLVDFCKNVYETLTNVHLNLYTNFNKDILYYKELISYNVEISITYHYIADAMSFYNNVKTLCNTTNATINVTVMYEPTKIEETKMLYLKLLEFNNRIQTLELSEIITDRYYRCSYNYSKKDKECYDSIILKKNNDYEFIVKYNTGDEEKLTFYDLQDTQISTKNWKCYAGIEFLDIDVNGNVFSCITNNKKIFNINDNAELFNFPIKPIICNAPTCQCKWEITKERIFK